MASGALENAMQRLKDGDMSAFDFIYDNTYKVVFFVAHSVLKNRAAAEDIVQETYLAAFKNYEKYRSDSLLAWLTTIAKRLAINAYNRGKHDVFTDFVQEEYRFGETTLPDEDSIGLISLAETLLSAEDFDIVIMCAVAGYKRREVSKILDIPVSTVTYKYSQALKLLKNKISGGAKDEKN